jgi:hypothetical protein
MTSMWTLAYGHHEDRTPTHGYEPTREAAMHSRRGGAGMTPLGSRSRDTLILKAREPIDLRPKSHSH